MGKADEVAERTVAVEAVGEIAVTRASAKVALVPKIAGAGVEDRSQPVAIESGVRRGSALAEEPPEIGVLGQGAQAGDLEFQKRQVGFVEIDGVDLGRPRREIRQRIASAGRYRDDARSDRQLQRGKVGFRIFP